MDDARARRSQDGRLELPGGPLWDVALPQHLEDVIAEVTRRRLTYLPEDRLRMLAYLAVANESENREGIVVEAGCGLGGSTVVLGAAKHPTRPLQVYDVFDTIPPPGEHDGLDAHARYEVIRSGRSEGIGGDTYYGYLDHLQDHVRSVLSDFGLDPGASRIALIKGLVQETFQIDQPVALAHLDVDWYEPVTLCLERVYPWLVPGGAIVIDDYHDWSGCRKASDDFFRDKRRRFELDYSGGPLVARLTS